MLHDKEQSPWQESLTNVDYFSNKSKIKTTNLKFCERANPETWCPNGKIIELANCGILQISNLLKSFTETNLGLTRYPGVTPLHGDDHAQSYLLVFRINLLHVVYSEEKVHNLRPVDKS